jgi:hypothetical protein
VWSTINIITLDSALEGLKEGFALPEIFELKLSNRTTANTKVYMTTNRTLYDYLRATQSDFQKVESTVATETVFRVQANLAEYTDSKFTPTSKTTIIHNDFSYFTNIIIVDYNKFISFMIVLIVVNVQIVHFACSPLASAVHGGQW